MHMDFDDQEDFFGIVMEFGLRVNKEINILGVGS